MIRSGKVFTQNQFATQFLKTVYGYDVDRAEIRKVEAVRILLVIEIRLMRK